MDYSDSDKFQCCSSVRMISHNEEHLVPVCLALWGALNRFLHLSLHLN